MKTLTLALLLSVSVCSVAHAQDSKSTHGKTEKKAPKSAPKSDKNVTVLDMSGPDEPEDAMPTIVAKGKL